MLARSRLLLLALSLLSFAGQAATNEAAAPTVVGEARDLDSGEFLYSEHHSCDEQRQLCSVRYLDSAGALFAEKHLDYSLNALGPSVHLNDYRRDLEIRIDASEQEGLIVDAGFDNFVRSIWGRLETDEQIEFPFLVAGFDKPLNMKALRSDTCSADLLCLKIKLNSWFLGMLVAPIELAYSLDEKKLLRFRGVSNIKGIEGESLMVDIAYQYN